MLRLSPPLFVTMLQFVTLIYKYYIGDGYRLAPIHGVHVWRKCNIVTESEKCHTVTLLRHRRTPCAGNSSPHTFMCAVWSMMAKRHAMQISMCLFLSLHSQSCQCLIGLCSIVGVFFARVHLGILIDGPACPIVPRGDAGEMGECYRCCVIQFDKL